MTPSRSVDRSIQTEREDLEALFGDVVVAVLGEDAEAVATGCTPDAGLGDDAVAALLAIHDERDDTHLGVHVRLSLTLARILATRMLACPEPAGEDLLDAVGELGNIAGGNVKSLLFTSARLSLPSATLDDSSLPPSREGWGEPTVIRALVLGEVAELALVPHVHVDGLLWPPSGGSEVRPEVLEAQS